MRVRVRVRVRACASVRARVRVRVRVRARARGFQRVKIREMDSFGSGAHGSGRTKRFAKNWR